jgi:hypothetical protein
MIEPTLLELPRIPETNERFCNTKIQKVATVPPLVYSVLFHFLVLVVIILSGASFLNSDSQDVKVQRPAPLRAFMVTPSQLNKLRVIPVAPVVQESKQAIPQTLEKEMADIPPVEPEYKADPIKPNLDAFKAIEERLASAQEATRRVRGNNNKEVASLVERLQKHREELIDKNLPSGSKPALGDFIASNEKIKPTPKATAEQKEVKGLVMDPLFLYQQQIAEKIRSYMRVTQASSESLGNCIMGLSLSRDGTVLGVNELGGEESVCNAARKATIRAGGFDMPDDEALYQELSHLTITIKPIS